MRWKRSGTSRAGGAGGQELLGEPWRKLAHALISGTGGCGRRCSCATGGAQPPPSDRPRRGSGPTRRSPGGRCRLPACTRRPASTAKPSTTRRRSTKLRTYPVYVKGTEPKGYRDWMRAPGPSAADRTCQAHTGSRLDRRRAATSSTACISRTSARADPRAFAWADDPDLVAHERVLVAD